MSSDNPPYPYYNGIPFNPSFFTSDTGGLSQATANNLYIRKTVADTTNVQETFTQPIFVSQLKGLTTASTMYVGNNITTGSVVLGNTGIRTKIDGTLETVAIRTPATGSSLIIGDTLTTGNVDIGSTFSQTYLRGTVNADTIQGLATTGNQSFFTTKTTGNLNVFPSSGSTAVFNVKGSGLKVDTISTDNPTLTQSLYSNKTAGTLSIATSQTSGNINVGGVGSLTTIKGGFQVDAPIVPNYSAPTLNTQIGYIYEGVINNTSVSSTFNYCTISSIPTGIWLFTWSIQSNGGAVGQYYSDFTCTGCTPATTGANTTVAALIGVVGNYYNATGSCICKITSATGTATLRGTLTMVSGTQGSFNGYCNGVRIA
jgi:hypothetical protein